MRKISLLALFIVISSEIYASSMPDIIFGVLSNLKSELGFDFEINKETDEIGDITFVIKTEDGGIVSISENDGAGAYFSTPNAEALRLAFWSNFRNAILPEPSQDPMLTDVANEANTPQDEHISTDMDRIYKQNSNM